VRKQGKEKYAVFTSLWLLFLFIFPYFHRSTKEIDVTSKIPCCLSMMRIVFIAVSLRESIKRKRLIRSSNPPISVSDSDNISDTLVPWSSPKFLLLIYNVRSKDGKAYQSLSTKRVYVQARLLLATFRSTNSQTRFTDL